MSALLQVFDRLYANCRRVLGWQFRLNLLQYGHSFLTIVLPTVIIANDVLSGQLEVGRAIQAAGAFAAILGALTIIVQNFDGLSRFSAGIDRLHTFSQALDDVTASKPDVATHIQTTPGDCLALHGVSVFTPDYGQRLVQGLTLTVAPGQGLMIVGPSGAGKSSLLRAMAGLWNTGAGTITRPTGAHMLFLPQQPYLPLGDLRCQLTYPQAADTFSDGELLQWLNRVNLPTLAERFGGLGTELDWSRVLSVGEQQRLAFARALLARPRYLLLDESTSALDAANEALLYGQLAALGITPISVSHHHAIASFHHQTLELHGDGGWGLRGVGDTQSTSPGR